MNEPTKRAKPKKSALPPRETCYSISISGTTSDADGYVHISVPGQRLDCRDGLAGSIVDVLKEALAIVQDEK